MNLEYFNLGLYRKQDKKELNSYLINVIIREVSVRKNYDFRVERVTSKLVLSLGQTKAIGNYSRPVTNKETIEEIANLIFTDVDIVINILRQGEGMKFFMTISNMYTFF